MAHALSFLADTYATERLKTLSVWAHFQDAELAFRPAPSARSPHEHMVHQCVSEDAWMRTMLALDVGKPPLPVPETRLGFLETYAAASRARLERLRACSPAWFAKSARFFDVERSRAWILLRRIAHTAHHRGQLTVYLRLLGRPLYSTYGPTADTGGLYQDGAAVIYRYGDLHERGGTGQQHQADPGRADTEQADTEQADTADDAAADELLAAVREGRAPPPLPGPGAKPPTERP